MSKPMLPVRLCCSHTVLHMRANVGGEDFRFVVRFDAFHGTAQLQRADGTVIQEITGERLNKTIEAQRLFGDVVESAHTEPMLGGQLHEPVVMS